MATGILGSTLHAGTGWITLYTVPASKIGSVILNLCNTSTDLTLNARIAIGTGATPTGAMLIESNVVLEPGTVYERTGLVLAAGQKIYVHTEFQQLIAVNVYGYETDA